MSRFSCDRPENINIIVFGSEISLQSCQLTPPGPHKANPLTGFYQAVPRFGGLSAGWLGLGPTV